MNKSNGHKPATKPELQGIYALGRIIVSTRINTALIKSAWQYGSYEHEHYHERVPIIIIGMSVAALQPNLYIDR